MRRGFSLSEVVGALAILVTVYLAVASLQSIGVRAATNMHEKVLAGQLANSLLAQEAQTRFDTRWPQNRQGTTTINATSYQWTMAVEALPNAPRPCYTRRCTLTIRWVGRKGADELIRQVVLTYPLMADPPPTIAPRDRGQTDGAGGKARLR